MSQSGFLLATLLAAFVLYLAAKNRLGTYAGVFFGAAAPLPTLTTSTSSATTSLPIPGASPQLSNLSPSDIAALATVAG